MSTIDSAIVEQNVLSHAPENDLVPLIDGPQIYETIGNALLRASSYIYITSWAIDFTDVALGSEKHKLIWIFKNLIERNPTIDIKILYNDLDWRMGHFEDSSIKGKRKYSNYEKEQAAKYSNPNLKILVTKLSNTYGRYLTVEEVLSQKADYPIVLASHHQKSIIIDGKVAFVCGCDIVKDVADKTKWHDSAVMILGNGVREVEENFITRWNTELSRNPSPISNFGNISANRSNRSNSSNPQILQTFPIDFTSANARAQPKKQIKEKYLHLLQSASQNIMITNQYLRHTEIGEKLIAALARQVKVTIIIPNEPEETKLDSNDIVDRIISKVSIYATCKILGALFLRQVSFLRTPYTEPDSASILNDGLLKIFWPSPKKIPYIHSKAMIVDDRWSMLGSANLNGRSLEGNCDSELNALVDNLSFSAAFKSAINKSLDGRLQAISFLDVKKDELRSRITKEEMKAMQNKLSPAFTTVASLIFNLNDRFPGIQDAIMNTTDVVSFREKCLLAFFDIL
jgi:phosphatidylserine/phosphatidylglycerophosphate/cardiolipin synthase-like enzyme